MSEHGEVRPGLWCTREPDHDGPCAAWPMESPSPETPATMALGHALNRAMGFAPIGMNENRPDHYAGHVLARLQERGWTLARSDELAAIIRVHHGDPDIRAREYNRGYDDALKHYGVDPARALPGDAAEEEG